MFFIVKQIGIEFNQIYYGICIFIYYMNEKIIVFSFNNFVVLLLFCKILLKEILILPK